MASPWARRRSSCLAALAVALGAAPLGPPLPKPTLAFIHLRLDFRPQVCLGLRYGPSWAKTAAA